MPEIDQKIHRFHGGLVLPAVAPTAGDTPIRQIPLPSQIVLPVSQHAGVPAVPVVDRGDSVLKGEMVARAEALISAPVHASTSGTIVEIAERPVADPVTETALCVVIEPDGRDQWTPELRPLQDYLGRSPTDLQDHVRNAGIVGMGGAGFPTDVKLRARAQAGLHTLILNGAECDPGISSDDALLSERAGDVIAGAQAMLYALQVNHCIIAVEGNMPAALDCVRAAVAEIADERFEVAVVPATYPQGGERQLILAITGVEVPTGGLPIDIGFAIQNVGTAYSTGVAVQLGQPLISRIVTVTGDGFNDQGNFEVRLGTPVSKIIETCGGSADDMARLIVGGVMMGTAVRDDAVPVTKATNSILLATSATIRTDYTARACIRCGECSRVCPANLLPQQLYWYARAGEFDHVKDHSVFDCIECGCCDYVCPSHIPLTQYFRNAKSELWSQQRARHRADHARERYHDRLGRLANTIANGDQIHANAYDELPSQVDRRRVISDVMERKKTKQKQSGDSSGNSGDDQ